jgi:hypothetical protein
MTRSSRDRKVVVVAPDVLVVAAVVPASDVVVEVSPLVAGVTVVVASPVFPTVLGVAGELLQPASTVTITTSKIK